MRNKIALFLAAILFFNIILPSKVFASSVQDQSKPIFGLTADQVVEKYNQLSDQQKDQVLRSLGNTSIFANSLFGNIFNSTFGAVNDAVKKLGDLFFQANGLVYKLGSSALSWISRLIDKVFNNDLSELNISQPVIDDLYKNTRGLDFLNSPFFVNNHFPAFYLSKSPTHQAEFNATVLPCPYTNFVYTTPTAYYTVYGSSNRLKLLVDLDNSAIYCAELLNFHSSALENVYYYSVVNPSFSSLPKSIYLGSNAVDICNFYNASEQWRKVSDIPCVYFGSFQNGDYIESLRSILNIYFVSIDYYFVISQGTATRYFIGHDSETINITNNTYYNYIYNIPDQTPLNVNNIVSNTAINFDPVENLIQYLPDNYNIEQNFTVVNNYFISSGSAITSQAIDVNLVSPGVIDVRVINPEDLTQQVTNNVSKDIINNTDVNFGDLDFSPSITVGLNAAKDSIEGIVPVTGSSIVAQFVSGIPPDWLALGFVFLILFIAAGFGMSIIRH